MKVLKKIYYEACTALPISLFSSAGPSGVLLPYHHTVSNDELQHVHHLYQYKSEKAFSDDLDFLLKHYKPIAVDDLWNAVISKNSIPKGSFLLSFDDGFREVYDTVAPLLKKKGVPAIFFINPAFIDNKELFYRCKISILLGELKRNESRYLKLYAAALNIDTPARTTVEESLKKVNQNNAGILNNIAEQIGYSFQDFLDIQKPFLTTSQLRELHDQGFTIGAHSMNHPYYKLLTVEEQVKQTLDSCDYVKQLLNTDLCHFSFPHSDEPILQETIDRINQQNNGLLFGIQNQKNESHNRMLHRFNAERPETNMEQLVKGQVILNSIAQLAGRNTVKRN
ncbi:MAG: hypothetical protein EOO13_03625 [Chitinophagaceae bacterium]|nr:MAG: hypothetical protein EOO13_03625 [Chitinophagaceae bacterium]